MSNTRRAVDGAPLSQEKYCSSTRHERGLTANLVAMRCHVLDDPEDRELVWFLQRLSHDIGLQKVADELTRRFPERIGAPVSRPQGKQLRQHLEAEKDESDPQKAITALPEWIVAICLNPDYALSDCQPWFFPSLVKSLRDYMTIWIAERQKGGVVTEVGRRLSDTLDMSLRFGCLTMCEGRPRTGKSFAAKQWCDAHPGLARLVQVPSSNDDISFFRAIADGIGCSSALSLKGVQLRERVEDALQKSKLALILDESHYLWPQNDRRKLPVRINWLMTALVNKRVPVGLVTTPQFSKDQSIIEKMTGWTSEQFIGRIAHYEPLPDTLSDSELKQIAEHLLPEGDERSIRALVECAKASHKYLSAIESTVLRARFLAGKEGREECLFRDVCSAVRGSILLGAMNAGRSSLGPAQGERLAPSDFSRNSDGPLITAENQLSHD
jgi:AAA domain